VVWTFHDCWAITGHCAYFDYIGCNKWKTICNHCPQKTEYPASLLIDRSNKNHKLKKELFTSVKSMVVVPVSNWLKEIVLESFMQNIPVQTIHNGIDISIFKPQCNDGKTRTKYGVNNKFMLLGVASPWTRRKGLNDFIELSKYLYEDEIIVLVGLNSNQIKLLPKNIIGLTKTENKQQLADLYGAASVFMNLSVEETFGLTTAEALACGTPAIVYNATACPEIIDPYTGIVVEKGSITGLVNAIKVIKEKGKNSYSAACRKRAEENYEKNKQFFKYIELYNSLLSK
jgi:glycosyltransferase involved in cell wall biosynthesis